MILDTHHTITRTGVGRENIECVPFTVQDSWLSEILHLEYPKKKERSYYCERRKVVSFLLWGSKGKLTKQLLYHYTTLSILKCIIHLPHIHLNLSNRDMSDDTHTHTHHDKLSYHSLHKLSYHSLHHLTNVSKKQCRHIDSPSKATINSHCTTSTIHLDLQKYK